MSESLNGNGEFDARVITAVSNALRIDPCVLAPKSRIKDFAPDPSLRHFSNDDAILFHVRLRLQAAIGINALTVDFDEYALLTHEEAGLLFPDKICSTLGQISHGLKTVLRHRKEKAGRRNGSHH